MPFPIVPAPSTATVLIDSKLTHPPLNSQLQLKETPVRAVGQAAQRRAQRLSLLSQNKPRSQRGVLFILRPRRPKAIPHLRQSSQEPISLRPERLHAALQQLPLPKAPHFHSAIRASVPQRLTEMFTIRSMNQRV